MKGQNRYRGFLKSWRQIAFYVKSFLVFEQLGFMGTEALLQLLFFFSLGGGKVSE